MSPSALRLELYAKIVAELSTGADESAVWEAHGLDATSYGALEQEIEGALSRAMDEPGDNPAGFVIAYDRALCAAQVAARSSAPKLSVEDLGRAVAAVSSGQDPVKALEAIGLTPAAVVRGVLEHGSALATHPELLEKLFGIKAR